MKKMLKLAGLLIALTVSGAASANHPHDTDAPSASQISGRLDGTISSVDMARGRLVIRSGEQSYMINALPSQLLGLREGMQVTIPYKMERGAAWIPAQTGGGIADLKTRLGEPQTRQGVIGDVDAAAGVVMLEHQQFHVHPKLLRHLRSGQQVSVQYVPVQGSNWIVAIHPQGVGFGQGPESSPSSGMQGDMGPMCDDCEPQPSQPIIQTQPQQQPPPQPEAQPQPQPQAQPQPQPQPQNPFVQPPDLEDQDELELDLDQDDVQPPPPVQDQDQDQDEVDY